MVEKLRSITKPIPWSLLLKPLAVAAAWLLLPWWGFLVVAAYCYFFPFFRPAAVGRAFFVFLLLGILIPPGFFQAVGVAIVFLLILGIKDLVIVKRKAAYGMLVFLLSFGGSLLLFARFPSWSSPMAF